VPPIARLLCLLGPKPGTAPPKAPPADDPSMVNCFYVPGIPPPPISPLQEYDRVNEVFSNLTDAYTAAGYDSICSSLINPTPSMLYPPCRSTIGSMKSSPTSRMLTRRQATTARSQK
jgi:hypothetical protein